MPENSNPDHRSLQQRGDDGSGSAKADKPRKPAIHDETRHALAKALERLRAQPTVKRR